MGAITKKLGEDNKLEHLKQDPRDVTIKGGGYIGKSAAFSLEGHEIIVVGSSVAALEKLWAKMEFRKEFDRDEVREVFVGSAKRMQH